MDSMNEQPASEKSTSDVTEKSKLMNQQDGGPRSKNPDLQKFLEKWAANEGRPLTQQDINLAEAQSELLGL